MRHLIRSARLARFVTSLPDGRHRLRISVWDENSKCLCSATEYADVEDECYTLSLKPVRDKLEPFVSYRVVLKFDHDDTISIPVIVLPADAAPELDEATELDEVPDSMLVYSSFRGDDLTPIRFAILPRVVSLTHASIAVSSAISDLASGAMPLFSSNDIRVDVPATFVLFHQTVGIAGRLDLLPDGLGLFASGLTIDINGDGTFALTAGVAAYDNGVQDYVIAPFVGFDYVSSQSWLYVYSGVAACVNASTYLSGELGLGARLSQAIELRAGFRHTEMAAPAERDVRFFDGLRAGMVYRP